MAKFDNEITFPTQFGTTTSDRFHVDSDAVRYFPDVVNITTGEDKDGNHASVETALKKRVVTITLNGETYSVDAEGNIDLGEVIVDKSDTISGITIQSGSSVNVSIDDRNATISLVPTELSFDTTKKELTLIDEFGVSGNPIALGLHFIGDDVDTTSDPPLD